MGGVVWKNVVMFLNLHTNLISRAYMMRKEMKRNLLIVLLLLFVSKAAAQNVTLSNNLLYDAWLTPNLTVGVRASEHWSLGLTAGYRPWPTNDETSRKWRHVLISPELRYWKDSVNVHHFFGANLIYSHFNVADVRFPFGLFPSVRDERRQGDLFAIGAFYGYSWVLGRHWNLEALIGVAVGYAKYDRYACGHCGTKISDESKLFLMPQAGINIVYNIPGRPCKQQEPVAIDPNAQETLRQFETDKETTK